jgi:hypothetical protein
MSIAARLSLPSLLVLLVSSNATAQNILQNPIIRQ